jgi:hypothetical protein
LAWISIACSKLISIGPSPCNLSLQPLREWRDKGGQGLNPAMNYCLKHNRFSFFAFSRASAA